MESQDAIKTFRKDFQAALNVLSSLCNEGLELPELVEVGGLLNDLEKRSKKLLEKLKPKLRKHAAKAQEEDEESVTLRGTLTSKVVVRIQPTQYVLIKGVTQSEVEAKLGDRAPVFFEWNVSVRKDIKERMEELATPEELRLLVKLVKQQDPTPRVSFQSEK